MSKIRDFDAIVKEDRLARISGEEVNVTKIPSRVTLSLAKFADGTTDMGNEETFFQVIDLVAKACQPSNPKITADWLLDNTDFDQLMDFAEFVMEPIRDRANKADEGKGGGKTKN